LLLGSFIKEGGKKVFNFLCVRFRWKKNISSFYVPSLGKKKNRLGDERKKKPNAVFR
tara:strand:+ start:445 stop:615 length:171 start_codon:yes stop_codon:yes gene_type:complete